MVQNGSKQMSVDSDMRGQRVKDFLLGGSNITDLFKERGFWNILINTYFLNEPITSCATSPVPPYSLLNIFKTFYSHLIALLNFLNVVSFCF